MHLGVPTVQENNRRSTPLVCSIEQQEMVVSPTLNQRDLDSEMAEELRRKLIRLDYC